MASLRIVSVQAETFNMMSFDLEPNLALGRVLVIASDGQITTQWWTTVEDAPRVGEVWIGNAQEARRG